MALKTKAEHLSTIFFLDIRRVAYITRPLIEGITACYDVANRESLFISLDCGETLQISKFRCVHGQKKKLGLKRYWLTV